jgi:phenylacetate-coenzyme A ligase PaaK-like adenylate-forming protein
MFGVLDDYPIRTYSVGFLHKTFLDNTGIDSLEMNLSLYLRAPFVVWRSMRNQRAKRLELVRFQNKKLQALVKHSYDHVSYYHSLFREARLHPDDIKTVDDLGKIPISKKENIRDLPLRELTATNIDLGKCLEFKTSGTTGTPLTIFWGKKARLINDLEIYLWQLRCGQRITDRQVVLAGWMPSPPHNVQKLGIFKTKAPLVVKSPANPPFFCPPRVNRSIEI